MVERIERAQEQAALGAFEEGDEILVHRRVLDQRAHRAFPGRDLVAHRAQIGHGRAEIRRRPAPCRPTTVLQHPSEKALPARQLLGDLPEVPGEELEIPGDRTVLGIEEQRGEEAVTRSRLLGGPPERVEGGEQRARGLAALREQEHETRRCRRSPPG